MRAPLRLALSAALSGLAGCASPNGSYPSLQPRAGEAIDPRVAVIALIISAIVWLFRAPHFYPYAADAVRPYPHHFFFPFFPILLVLLLFAVLRRRHGCYGMRHHWHHHEHRGDHREEV